MVIRWRILQTGALLVVILAGCGTPPARDETPASSAAPTSPVASSAPPEQAAAAGSGPAPIVSVPLLAQPPASDAAAAAPKATNDLTGSVMAGKPAARPATSAAPRPAASGKPGAGPAGTASVPPGITPGKPVAAPAMLRAYADDVAARRGLDADRVLGLLQQARYNPQVAKLIAPAAGGGKIRRSWTTYRQRFLDAVRLREGRAFMASHARELAEAERRYGVPAEIIAAIIGVETLYGRNTGNFRVLDALATLAFHYPDPTRADRMQLFNDQLADFLELCVRNGLDGRRARGSYAGAMGMPQFMPGSILRHAVDGDGDGRIDLAASVPDSVMSVANFLVAHGWQRGLPVFAPVTLPPEPSGLVKGGLTPQLTWQDLQAAGARSDAASAAWQQAMLGVIDLPDESAGRVEYRTATPNFFALTHYNRSYFYATAVADLAAALAPHRQAVPGVAAK